MTKKEYFKLLKKELDQTEFSTEEKNEIIEEIEERFVVAREKKETISQVIEKLGTPENLVKSYLNTEIPEEKKAKSRPIEQKILMGIVLIVLNLLFVVWILLGIYATILSFIAAGGAVMFAGLLLAAAPALTTLLPISLPMVPAPLIVATGITIALCALTGVLILVQILIWAIKLTGKYFSFNVKLVEGNL